MSAATSKALEILSASWQIPGCINPCISMLTLNEIFFGLKSRHLFFATRVFAHNRVRMICELTPVWPQFNENDSHTYPSISHQNLSLQHSSNVSNSVDDLVAKIRQDKTRQDKNIVSVSEKAYIIPKSTPINNRSSDTRLTSNPWENWIRDLRRRSSSHTSFHCWSTLAAHWPYTASFSTCTSFRVTTITVRLHTFDNISINNKSQILPEVFLDIYWDVWMSGWWVSI